MKSYLKNRISLEAMKLQAGKKSETLPIRVQAYERLMLFCERINIEQLVYRLREPNMKVRDLQSVLMIAVQQEYEHNLSQQIYASSNLWKIIELAKNEVLNTIVTTAERFNPEDEALSYSNALLSGRSTVPILDKAKEALRSEVQLLF
ncbi:hypothetical protein GCM10007940_18260 [Portibacter lacus]|uniref:Uncharacterized protein n=2 Tax=Portibacter lacus TaxID=1099794 RepID=A0AA37SR22_9BACT|nr:hypothetical protein GCM10007940_18260 [Portibacter lacus]